MRWIVFQNRPSCQMGLLQAARGNIAAAAVPASGCRWHLLPDKLASWHVGRPGATLHTHVKVLPALDSGVPCPARRLSGACRASSATFLRLCHVF